MIEESIVIPLFIIFVLLLISAFFSGSETSLTAVSRAKIHRLRGEGNKNADQVSKLRSNKDRLIGTILLGNNVVNIAASALATAIAIHYFGDNGVAYATIIMTLMVLIFAEMLPKTYAFKNTEKAALFVAPIFIVLVKILSPITHTLQIFVDILLSALGLKDKMNEEEVLGTEALRGAIEMHHDAGVVVKGDRDMLDSILDLSDTEIHEIMIHRKNVETISMDQDARDIITQVLNSQFTRIPLWKGDPDNIVGILHVKDLLKGIYQEKEKPIVLNDLTEILMKPWFVPETTSLKAQLHTFLEKKNHFALVVDEYGDLQGIVTLEDILEEIVGQIEDEYDDKENILPQIVDQGDEHYIVEGMVTIRDLNRELDWDLPDDEAVTVAGLIIHEAKHIPDAGQMFQFHGYRFEIIGKKRNQVTKIRIKKLEEAKN